MEINLPQGWAEIELIEVAADTDYPIGDGDHGQIKPAMYKDKGVPYIRVSDMGWGNFKPDNLVYIDKETHRNNLKSELFPGDVLIAKTGATIGKCCIVPDFIETANTTSSVGKVTLDQRLMSPKYLLNYFLSREFKDFMWSISERTAQPGFNIRDMVKFKIPLPPKAEHDRIVAKLDAIMQKVESNKQRLEKIPKLLKRFRQSVLAAAVNGDLTKEWRKKNDVTEAWKEKRLGDLVDVIGGFAFKSTSFLKEGRNQVFRIGNVKPYDLYFDYSPVFVDDEIANDTARYEAKENDILISMTGTKYKRDYGFAGIMKKSDKKVFVNQRVSNIRCKKEINPFFLLHWLQTDAFRNHFFSGETGNVNQGNVGMDGIREAMIALPSHAEQTEIAETINKLFAFADKLEVRYTKAKAMLDKLPQSILAKAFRGELVAQDPNDEPASVLLERIKKEKEKLAAEKKVKYKKAKV